MVMATTGSTTNEATRGIWRRTTAKGAKYIRLSTAAGGWVVRETSRFQPDCDCTHAECAGWHDSDDGVLEPMLEASVALAKGANAGRAARRAS